MGTVSLAEVLNEERYLEFLQNDLIPALAVLYVNEDDPENSNDAF